MPPVSSARSRAPTLITVTMPGQVLELGGMERRGPGLWPGRPNPPTMARARTTFAMLRLAGAPARDGGGPARHPLGRHPEPPEDRALDDTGSQPGCQGLDQAERNVALWQADGHGTVLCALAARPLRRMPRLGFRGCSTTIAGSAAHRSMPAKPTSREGSPSIGTVGGSSLYCRDGDRSLSAQRPSAAGDTG
jgi:hypothetical protein